MKILSRSFTLLGIIVFAFGCLAEQPSVRDLREDAIHHLEHAIEKLQIGHLNQASEHVLRAANNVQNFSWRLSRELRYIARKIRRTHYHNEDDEEFVDEMIHVLDDIMEVLEDDEHHDEHHKKNR